MNDNASQSPSGACPIKISNILVPVDMDDKDASDIAVQSAAWFAGQTGASVSMLTVAFPFGDSITEMAETHQPEFEAFVTEMSEKHGCEIGAIFRSHESVNHVIHQVIEAQDIDFVIMATHRPRLTDHLFGSHSSQTALHNDCSVLVLRGS